MYLWISLPILIANLIIVPYALWDIRQQYKHTTLKPRLIMVSLMMVANVPTSLLNVLATVINNGWLENRTNCYIFHTINMIVVLKGLSLMALTILVFSVVLKKFSASTLSKIGNVLNVLIFLSFLLFQCVLIPMADAKAGKLFKVGEKTYHRVCEAKATWFNQGSRYWLVILSFATLFISAGLLGYSYFKNRMRSGTSYARICSTFALYSFINFISATAFIAKKILRLELSETTENVLFDIQKIVPSLFAITYVISESVNRKKAKSIGIAKIMSKYQTRKLFFDFLTRMGERRQCKILNQWNEIESSNKGSYTVFNKEGLTKKEAQDYIEKHLEIDAFGFCCSDEYIDYFESRRKKGEIDAELEAELYEVK